MKQNSYLISCNKNYLPFSTRKLLYNALIRPLMDFGAEIWGHANINLTNKIQKNIIRHVVKSENFIDHTNQHFVKLQTLKFPDLIMYHQARLCHKIVHTNNPPGLKEIFEISTSQRRCFDIKISPQSHCNNANQKLPNILAPKVWNALDSTIKNATEKKPWKQQYTNSFLPTTKMNPHAEPKIVPPAVRIVLSN